jgi:hypothetical protein
MTLTKRQFYGIKDGNYVVSTGVHDNCEFQDMLQCNIEQVLDIKGCLDDNFFNLFGITCKDWDASKKYSIARIDMESIIPEACANGEPTLIGNKSYTVAEHPNPDIRHFPGEGKISRFFQMAIDSIKRNNSCQIEYIYKLQMGNVFEAEANTIRGLYMAKMGTEKKEFLDFLFGGFGNKVGKNASGYVGMFGDSIFGNQLAFTDGVLTAETPSTILYGNALASTVRDGVNILN